MTGRRLTEKQERVLAAMRSRRGARTYTDDLAHRVNDADPRVDGPFLTMGDVRAICRQLVRRGLLVEHGVKYGPKRWTLAEPSTGSGKE